MFPTIVGDEQAARWTTAGKEPRRSAVLPHIGNQLLRVVRIYNEISSACFSIHIQTLCPIFSAVRTLIHPSWAISPSRPSGTHIDLIGVRWIDQNPVNGASLFQAQTLPALTAVVAFVQPVTTGLRVSRVPLTCPHINDVRMGRINSDGTDRSYFLVLKERRPALPVICTHPQSTAGRSCIDRRGNLRMHRYAGHTSTHPSRADVSNAEPIHDLLQWRGLLLCLHAYNTTH